MEMKAGMNFIQDNATAQGEREAFKRALHGQRVFKLNSDTINAAEWAWFARPAQTAPQPEQSGLVEAWSGMKAIPVSAVEYEAIYRHNLGASPTSVVPGDGMTAKSGVSYIVSAALSAQGGDL